ncbi:hypothetical protein FACS189430_06640 [Bacteroidia bacterium]|nr:hypothetical protein FACS189430_06640 [Bacteroidia bacterium]
MIKEFLEEQVQRINNRSFIELDPVQFPRRYESLQDIEIVSFCVATIAWGRREMILRSAERMLAKMGESPCEYVMHEGYETLGEANVHRTFFEPDLAYMLRGFHKILAENESKFYEFVQIFVFYVPQDGLSKTGAFPQKTFVQKIAR